ncbi:hypothetical protein [Hyphomicrobium sp.]|nr:hypothetical protein [Hyphomicrobium sp.]HEX2842685.1 hypothetical protein [Hyphomicrobium sp.]
MDPSRLKPDAVACDENPAPSDEQVLDEELDVAPPTLRERLENWGSD